MLIAAVSDIHSPKFFDLFVKSLDLHIDNKKPDLFLLVGDIVDRGLVLEYRKIYNSLFGKINCPIVSCFGNSEYGPENTELMKKENPEIIFLEDESIVFDIHDKKIGVVGTKGSLDRPTFWQSKNIPGITEHYRDRIEKISMLLNDLDVDFKILMTHYVPTYKILEGENPVQFPEMGSRFFEKVIIERKPDIVLCGHSHRGKKQVWIDSVPVFNVGLTLNNGLTLIDTEKDLKAGLEKFF